MNNFVATHECDTGYDTFQGALNFIGKTDDPDKWRVCEMVEISQIPAAPAIPCAVNHPSHYTAHPSGVECIQITEHMGFNLGNALKYIWRADLKDDAVEDMRKAIFYLNREIAKRCEIEQS